MDFSLLSLFKRIWMKFSFATEKMKDKAWASHAIGRTQWRGNTHSFLVTAGVEGGIKREKSDSFR